MEASEAGADLLDIHFESGTAECSDSGRHEQIDGLERRTEAVEVTRASIRHLVEDQRGSPGQREAVRLGQ